MGGETFYDVLGVDRDADQSTIERAYRSRAKEYHPDVSDRPNAREQFKRINRARAVLTDRTERSRYDRLGHDVYLQRDRRGTSGGADSSSPQPPTHESTAGSSNEDTARSRTEATTGRTGGSGRRTETTTNQRSTRRDADTSTNRRSDSDPSTRLGRFAVTELVAAVALPVFAAAAVALTAVASRTITEPAGEVAMLFGVWAIVAGLAGRLAAGGSDALPAEVVRAHGFPLALFVSAWYVRLGTDRELLAVALIVYAAHATLFRTAALAAGRDRSTGRAAAVWFVGTAPAALVVYATHVAHLEPKRMVEPLGVASALPFVDGLLLAVVVASAVVVALSHALWRLRLALR